MNGKLGRLNNGLSKFFNFLIFSNIYLAIGAMLTTYMVIKLLGFSFNFTPILILFLTTFFIYNLNRQTDLNEDRINHPKRVEFIDRYKYLFPLSIIGYLFALILALQHNFMTFLMSLIPFILGFIYSVFRMKKIFLMKNIIVALGWASITLVVGAYFEISDLFINTVIWIIFLFIFLRILIVVIIFDIRDVVGDKIHNIQTFPVKYGIKKTKDIIIILNFLSLSVLLIGFILNLLPIGVSLIGIFTLFMGFLYIYLLNKKFDIKLLCEVIVDGEYILLGIISFIVISLV